MPKSVKLLIAFADIELDAGRTAKAARLLSASLERALALAGSAPKQTKRTSIEPSTLTGDLKGIYGLGGIPKRRPVDANQKGDSSDS